jgi:hypothetical protein
VLPIAALLWAASGLVVARSKGRGGRLAALATAAVCGGLALRGSVGLIWATGIGTSPSAPFYWLNLLTYTPACLASLRWRSALPAAIGPRQRKEGVRNPEMSVRPRRTPSEHTPRAFEFRYGRSPGETRTRQGTTSRRRGLKIGDGCPQTQV